MRVRESLGLSGVNDVVHRAGIAVGEPLRAERLEREVLDSMLEADGAIRERQDLQHDPATPCLGIPPHGPRSRAARCGWRSKHYRNRLWTHCVFDRTMRPRVSSTGTNGVFSSGSVFRSGHGMATFSTGSVTQHPL